MGRVQYCKEVVAFFELPPHLQHTSRVAGMSTPNKKDALNNKP
jgi:hypothetical protein